MRGVFERPKGSGVWWINYYDQDGRRHREKIGREPIAEEAYLQRRSEVREGKFLAPRSASQFTFRQLAKERMASRKPHLRPSSYITDETRLAPLLEILGAVPARSITPNVVESTLAEIAGRPGCGPSTVNRYRTLMSGVFSHAVRNGRLLVNPVSRVPKRREPPGRNRFLSPHEERKLRAAVRKTGKYHEAELDLAIHTGMRRSEQFDLRWEQVDLDFNVLTVFGKTGRRTIQINERAAKALRNLHRISNGSEWVCPDRRKAQKDWRTWFEDSVRAAGIGNIRWHDLRHTFASRLVMAGVDIRSVQELLGHKSLQTTTRYAHLSQKHLHEAVEKLARWHQDGTSRKKKPLKVLQMPLL